MNKLTSELECWYRRPKLLLSRLVIGMCVMLAGTTSRAQQGTYVADQVTAEPNDGQESVAELAQKARQRNSVPPAGTNPDSLGEKARRFAEERERSREQRLQQANTGNKAHPGAALPARKATKKSDPLPNGGATGVIAQQPVVAMQGQRFTAPATKDITPPEAKPAAIPTAKPAAPTTPADAPPPSLQIRTDFKVKYVAENVVYLVGGKDAGLAQGMKLQVRRTSDPTAIVAEIEVTSVASSSAVCDVKNASGDIKPGDTAYLSRLDAENIAQIRSNGGARRFAQVVTFTEGDPLDEEAREEVPRPPLPEINRARGRIGLDYGGISSRGSSAASSYQIGGMLRADVTRIGGTYWNLSGYWRGRVTSSSYAGQATLQDLINRTYHLSMTYDNPKSSWVAGFGRLYLPWATSLDTLDGGYVGRRWGRVVTTGVFAGSTPDPTSWNYNPDRRIAGTFVSFQCGSFDNLRYTSTSGLALTSLGWVLDRPFVFFENGLFYKRYISVYQSLQADDPRPAPGVTKPGPGLSRSYTTLRFQPHRRISFDLNHNYFRDVPTFSQQLISTGLVDKYLFQGFSAGMRMEVIRHVTVYTDLGRSSRTGDQKNSLNQLYGVTWDHIWKTGLRADVRTSKFDSSFGSGSYRSLSLSRNLGDRFHWQVQAGRQTIMSSFTSQGDSRFFNSSLDASFGRHYFMQVDYTTQRSTLMDYDQWLLTLGYRFDNRQMGGAR